MIESHRVRRLRWQAGAPTPAQAFALRRLLHERADAVQAAIDRVLSEAATPGVWLHLPRLALKIDVPDLDELDDGLVPRLESALRAALRDAAPRAAGTGYTAPGDRTSPRIAAAPSPVDRGAGAPDAPPARTMPSAAAARDAWREYLVSGRLGWVLAGVPAESARGVLQDAARDALDEGLAGRNDPKALLPAAPHARLGALARWLQLLPAAARRRWLAASPRPATDADDATVSAWWQWIDAKATDRADAQALWLAWPTAGEVMPPSELAAWQAWVDARIAESVPVDAMTRVWPALRRALGTAATRPRERRGADARSSGTGPSAAAAPGSPARRGAGPPATTATPPTARQVPGGARRRPTDHDARGRGAAAAGTPHGAPEAHAPTPSAPVDRSTPAPGAARRSDSGRPIDRPHLAPARRAHVPAGEPAPAAASAPFAPDTDATGAAMVPHAGLVLLHPYLPRFLGGLGVLDDGGRGVADRHLRRACALLHGLACGDAEPAEFELPFVKLLLGRRPDSALDAALPTLSADDRAEIDALLDAVREHWSALRGTARDGLRISFLQRRGLLRHADGAWRLHLLGEPFDLLLALLPWSISLVRLPWMHEPLVVEWPTP